jgi:hypothetical protein
VVVWLKVNSRFLLVGSAALEAAALKRAKELEMRDRTAVHSAERKAWAVWSARL